MIALNVLYRFRPGTRAAFEEAVRAIDLLRCSRADEGNLSYEYFRPVEDENALLCVERWRDRQAFEAHLKTAHVILLQETKRTYVVETILHVYRPEQ